MIAINKPKYILGKNFVMPLQVLGISLITVCLSLNGNQYLLNKLSLVSSITIISLLFLVGTAAILISGYSQRFWNRQKVIIEKKKTLPKKILFVALTYISVIEILTTAYSYFIVHGFSWAVILLLVPYLIFIWIGIRQSQMGIFVTSILGVQWLAYTLSLPPYIPEEFAPKMYFFAVNIQHTLGAIFIAIFSFCIATTLWNISSKWINDLSMSFKNK